ncbi:hypothetical protein DL1_19595 [Thioclava dalianensis]|uniref:Uncharacterized protein n=1 Tax=Thioclava dalianensis TaxID=1185766 RepID=A0A074T7Z3_9RHOB|nr:hypothetical protein [Thioclava dalianensis]KEP67809.1 hypothetical protein DL1_19595 [Thioclava dalianensis]SFN48666.1 hypothetical protein SAMN05216224_10632 [Thioclava dalianensis]
MTIAIDMSQLVTAEDKAASAKQARDTAIKNECSAMIAATLDPFTLTNLQSAAIVGDLTTEQTATFSAAVNWITQMREACRASIEAGTDPAWPDLPEAVAALAKEF